MKTFTEYLIRMNVAILFLLIISTTAFSQTDTLVIYNGDDVKPEWFPVAVEEINNNASNPMLGEANPGQTVISIFRNSDGEPWEGGGIGGLEIDISEYTKFSLLVFKSDTGNVQLELQRESGNLWLNEFYDTPNEWKKIEYSVPDSLDSPDDTIVHTLLVAPHQHETAGTEFEGHNMYWDEVIAYKDSVSTSSEIISNTPKQFQLEQNYPNPFNPNTKIEYSVPKYSHVTVDVFNIVGQRVYTLVNKTQSPGNYSVNFDASGLTSGIYFYRLQAGSEVINRKMTLVK